ncbi:hypothetical protein [Streptomyces fagopyri]|uniref:hypothetical protein n=1 Tax=Streptomyces fagopyri TaxID=2662397 RepID=UPI0033C48BDF
MSAVAVSGLGHMGGHTAATPVMTADRVRVRAQVVVPPWVMAAFRVLDALERRDLHEVAAIDERERTSAPGDEARARFIHR